MAKVLDIFLNKVLDDIHNKAPIVMLIHTDTQNALRTGIETRVHENDNKPLLVVQFFDLDDQKKAVDCEFKDQTLVAREIDIINKLEAVEILQGNILRLKLENLKKNMLKIFTS